MPADVRFVYFDLGNVLVAFDPQIACANLGRLLGVSLAEAREAVYESGLQTRFESGAVSGEEYAEAVRARFGRRRREVATPAVLEAISAMFVPIDSMRSLVEQVRRTGLPVGVLSNTCRAHWEWILRQSYGVLGGEFRVTILSYEVGAMKPEERIYEVAERAAGVAGEQILFLDDRAENVAAARARGWKSEQCVGGSEAEAALERHGVIGSRRCSC